MDQSIDEEAKDLELKAEGKQFVTINVGHFLKEMFSIAAIALMTI